MLCVMAKLYNITLTPSSVWYGRNSSIGRVLLNRLRPGEKGKLKLQHLSATNLTESNIQTLSFWLLPNKCHQLGNTLKTVSRVILYHRKQNHGICLNLESFTYLLLALPCPACLHMSPQFHNKTNHV